MFSTNNYHSSSGHSNQISTDTLSAAAPDFEEEGLRRMQRVLANAQSRQPTIHFYLPFMARTRSINDQAPTPVPRDVSCGSSGRLSPEITDYDLYRSFHYGEFIAESVSEMSDAERSPEPCAADIQSGREGPRAPTPYPPWLEEIENAISREQASIPQAGTASALPIARAASASDAEAADHRGASNDAALRALYVYHITSRFAPCFFSLCLCGSGVIVFCAHLDVSLSQAEAGSGVSTSDIVWGVLGFLMIALGAMFFFVHFKENIAHRRAWELDHHLRDLRLVMRPVNPARASIHPAEPKEIELEDMAGRPESACGSRH